ncbi:MAG: AI-2E family transporter [Hydrococcus sp. CRU_1_1]|nr:AI-2E family transporter [Hydrococcus sp. CRU_1_1]
MKLGHWLGIIALGISVYILWQMRQMVLLLFAAIVLAITLNLLIEKFQTWRIKRGYAILLSGLCLIGALVSFFWLIVPPFIREFQQLVLLVPQGIEALITWIKELASRLDPELIQSLPTLQQLTQQLQPLVNQIAGRGLSFFIVRLGFR